MAPGYSTMFANTATDWQKAEICLDTSFVESPKYALAYAAHKMMYVGKV